MSKKPKMATFQVNNTDSACVMLDKLNSYVVTIKKEKYNNILKLLNELFEKNHKTLRNFVEIECEYFETQSITKTIKILETYKSTFNYDVDKIKKKDQKDPVEIKIKTGSKTEEFSISKEIFLIISKLLKSIEYKLIKFTKGNKQYYSILMC
jgi:hypothetical protein